MTPRNRARRGTVRLARLVALLVSPMLFVEGFYGHGIYTDHSAYASQARQAAHETQLALSTSNSQISDLNRRRTAILAAETSARKGLTNAEKACRNNTLFACTGLLAWINPNAESIVKEIDRFEGEIKTDSALLGTTGEELSMAASSVVSLEEKLRGEISASTPPDSLQESGAVVDIAISIFFVLLLAGTGARRRLAHRTAETSQPGMGQVAISGSGDHGWAQLLTVRLVSSAVRALQDPADRERFGEEWASDMTQVTGKWRQLRWAVLLRVFAPHGISAARRQPATERY